MPKQAQWRTSSLSDGLQCTAVADLGDDVIGVRDDKDRGGPVLHFTRDEFAAFIGGAKLGEFDDLTV